MHQSLIQDITLILLIGSIFGWFFKRFLKLPLVLGYIFGGLFIKSLASYFHFNLRMSTVQSLSEIGILLLVFSMGLHFSLHKIKALGLKVVIVAIAQAILMWVTGIKIAEFFGFEEMETLFIGAAMCVTSTAVIIKVLEDFQLKSARFVEKVFGLLLIEDSVAIFLIIWLTTKSTSYEPSNSSLILVLLPIFLGSIILWWILGSILVPRFVRAAFIAGKEELLGIISVGLAIGLAYLSQTWNFSPALGSFIMGSIMSDCREVIKIEALIEPIKNLFGLIFFVSVGLLFTPHVLFTKWSLIITLITFVIFVKVFYNFTLNIIFGLNLKDSLRISGCLVQIGEVSFVVAQAGRTLEVLSDEVFSVIVAVSVITMLTTPVFMKMFFYMSEKMDSLVPKPVLAGLEAYSVVMTDFSIAKTISKHKGKIGFFNKVGDSFSIIQNQVKKNYFDLIKHNKSVTFDRLAPWDEYLMSVSVVSDSIVSGKTLQSLKFRENFGINIVAIQRENRFIVSPKPNDVVISGDSLIVYGNEEAIRKLEQYCSQQIDLSMSRSIDDCMLGSIIISPSHPFVGKNILELQIRSTYNCLILAVRRNNERIKNPISTFVFESNDEIYIFGTKNSIAHISSLGSE